MILAVALLNIALGLAYTSYGIITALEMKNDWRSFGFSHFGAAWIAMAFTCGPHHLDHGLHVLADGKAGPLDLLGVVIGLPAGVIWLSLRIEAFLGGRGDRFILGTPRWLRAIPSVAVAYTAVMVTASIVVLVRRPVTFEWSLLSNAALVFIYCAIGYFLLRTQLRRRPGMSGWSVSGVSLTIVFPTCALMHGIFAVYALGGTYVHDIHGITIDWLSVPAGIYFLWVVRRLYRESLRDWNNGPDAVKPVAGAIAA
jgi:glycosyltransferase involved in cell wall biosynthesis